MTIDFQDSYQKQLSVDQTTYEKKIFLGRTKTLRRIRISIGKMWAEFDAHELSKDFFVAQNIAESLHSSNGPVFIANVDWAPESSLFREQVSGVPAHWWVLCFMDLESDAVQAAFAPEAFDEFLHRISFG